MCRMASELGAYYGGCAGCGADEAYHGALDDESAGQGGEKDERGSQQGKDTDLYC